jgi:hypothetical protein
MSGEEERKRTVHDCMKIKIEPKLLDRDCEGCGEVKICPMRANLLLERHQVVMPRITLAATLFGWSKMISLRLGDITASELRDMEAYAGMIEDVRAEEHRKSMENR